MNGEKHKGEQRKGAEDLWVPVTVPSDQPTAHDPQQLTAAGDGDEQRTEEPAREVDEEIDL